MTKRYHIPTVITTTDDVTREEAAQYVRQMLSNLEQTDAIHRTYVESSGIEDAEGERLLDMIERADEENINAAIEAMGALESDE
jgi:hypothetical protein